MYSGTNAYKKMTEGIVAQTFALDATTYQPGDWLNLVGNMQAGYNPAKPSLGELVTYDQKFQEGVIELPSAKIMNFTVGATPVPAGGGLVKQGATKNTVIPAAPGTTETDVPLVIGLALEGGATGAVIRVLVK